MTRDKEGKFVPENINTRYGKLTIIEFDHKNASNNYYYKCKCLYERR